ncbi:MAG: glucose 1-dehydrogenase [Gammaproteobacteria bacterium]|jgi:NAD(P)-dependent dehydrogenase (short-subunit alcohol dehydrogenase family)|nr:glucose 1-dehydrogenase [Gammaproteobacteria bacterium]MBP6052867.1 glucose 1-dehydrogenase [Pseudomonadales bacterium]MBK6582372.1 glucose 1-dehydrogenase [Gammaproteobacteria bacterium]MBK7171481.1 glucose 1-dehydrogenase [Gammaproteobacteria bacterium]MBK7521356.1 glucose 1-dehydrogenase [Gammaproteobacteria bacterium]
MTDLFDVSGKVVLITGGSRGLGKAMCLEFARRGARLAIVSRKLAECEKVARQARDLGAAALPLACHVGDWDSLSGLIDTVCKHFGRIDVLINNAGMSPLAPSLLETSELLFDKIIGVNLKGPLRLTALAAARMAQSGGGSIINISSLAALKPSPLTTVYSAAKAGLNALTVASAQEYASHNVRVNGIVCGTFDTDSTAGFVRNESTLPQVIEPIAMKRVGEPREVVGACIYFASAASSYTTGTLLCIDGGARP